MNQKYDMFITLIVVMILWVYVYIQTHQIVHIKYVLYFVYIYLSTTIKRIIKKIVCLHFFRNRRMEKILFPCNFLFLKFVFLVTGKTSNRDP